VLREGEEASVVYLLTGGNIALEVEVPGRGTIPVESLHGGDILGLSWLFAPYRWQLDARAVERSTAIAVDASRLRAALDADPALGYAIVRRLAGKLYDRLERVRLQRLDVYGDKR